MKHSSRIETRLSHSGLCTDKSTGALSTPIFQTATFSHPEIGKTTGYDYSRTANPTRTVLEKNCAELEHGSAAYAFSSGMAAISSLMSLFKPGDRVLVCDDLYGGTYRLFEKVFRPWGLEADYADFCDLSLVKSKIIPRTRAFFIESPTNPMLKIIDIRKTVALAKSCNVLLIVDNTFMTPYCQNPLLLGADIVVHSGTKYLAGHNDTLAGVVVSREKKIAEKIAFTQNATGGVLSAFDSWLVLRGLKTLAVRMDRAQQNADAIARWLLTHKAVSRVYYPGLSSHGDRPVHRKQASGAGAIISFRVRNAGAVRRIIRVLKTITFAESLGGVESLITYPISQTHADIPSSLLRKIGISDNLLRLSVGIEHCDDLIGDLEQALGQ